MLCFANVGVSMGHRSLIHHCSCHIKNGRFIGILGPNGCGKTTLLKAMLGQIDYTGEITYLGYPLEAKHTKIAYLPQQDQPLPDFPITVEEVIAMGHPHYFQVGRWKERIGSKIQTKQIMEHLDIYHLSNTQLVDLSGGELRRVYFARLYLQESDLLLLDEPLAGLDEKGIVLVVSLCKGLVAQGKTVIAVHHDLETVEQVFDEVLVFRHHTVLHMPAKDYHASQPEHE